MTGSGAFRWLSLGGVGEIGKNCYVVEIDNKIIVIDVGMSFPDVSMFGVDIVIPDFSYLVKNQQRIKGIVLTHGHEDHIGSLPYLLQDLKTPPPIYGSRFTLALLRGKLPEFGLGDTPLTEFKPGDDFVIDGIQIATARVTHSIPDSCSVAVKSSDGWYLHSGDFKLDPTPVDGKLTDFEKLARIGDEGVLAVGVDVTNVERPGRGGSESSVREGLSDYVRSHQGRVFITTFASNIHRTQQAIDVAVQHNRKVLILGRTMVQNVEMSLNLGYLKAPPNVLVGPHDADKIKPDRLLVMLTGSQGEPLAAMARLANGDHRYLSVKENDLFIFSARPIPGNEIPIYGIIDQLFRLGAEVIYGIDTRVHVSGHGYQDEIREYIQIVRPRYVLPVHGFYRHQMRLKKLLPQWGIAERDVAISSLGEVFEVSKLGFAHVDNVKSGEVFIAGDGASDISRRMITERQALAEDGIVVFTVLLSEEGNEVLGTPQILAKGFIPRAEDPELFVKLENAVIESIYRNRMRSPEHVLQLRNNVQNAIQRIIFQDTSINPVVIGMVSYADEKPVRLEDIKVAKAAQAK